MTNRALSRSHTYLEIDLPGMAEACRASGLILNREDASTFNLPNRLQTKTRKRSYRTTMTQLRRFRADANGGNHANTDGREN
jgi:hypothetical protein